MRGDDRQGGDLFSYVSLEERVPKKHPLRNVKRIADKALSNLDWRFDELYSREGRPSIPPECLIRASLLQILYSIRSERQLMEQLDYNLLFRWFVGLTVDEPVWHPTTFTKNRDRLTSAEVGQELFEEVLRLAKRKGLTSNDHFSVDGTLIRAWASQKSIRPKDDEDDGAGGGGRNAPQDFHGERRKNDTHESRTDPEARLARKGKGKEAHMSYAGHIVIEHRNGLVVNAMVTQATGSAECEAASDMAMVMKRGATLAADKGYDKHELVDDLRTMGVTPHIAQNHARPGGSAIDDRTTRHEGYKISQRLRKRVEEPFGWAKTVGSLRQTKYRGVPRVNLQFLLTMAAYNLRRMANLGVEIPV